MLQEITVLYVVLLALTVVLSAFFSSAEAAFLSVQRVRAQHMVGEGIKGAQRMLRMVERPDRLLPTILLGNSLVNTTAAALGTALALSIFKDTRLAIIVATIVVTIVLLVFGETVPKIVAIRRAERLALALAVPLTWLERILFPVSMILQWISRGVTYLIGARVPQRALVTEEEIKLLISVGADHGVVERDEAAMLHRVFQFGDRQVQEVMTPRTEIIWMEQRANLEEALKVFADHQHSRLPVFEGGIENVVGVLSIKDVVRALSNRTIQLQEPIAPLLRPPHFVPETKLVGQLFDEMRKDRDPLVMVVDEFGGLEGLVTLKQLVEEVFGRVLEEQAEEEFQEIDAHTLVVDGGMRVDEANEKLGLGLPDGKYETVAGFVLECLGRIPEEGDDLAYGNLHLVVTEMKGVKIGKVTVLLDKQVSLEQMSDDVAIS